MCKSLIRMATAVVMILMMESCQKEYVSYPPEYYRSESGYKLYFTLVNPKQLTVFNQNEVKRVSQCKVGDSVTVFLPVVRPGVYIYRTDYKWTSDSEKLGPVTIKDDKDPCSEDYPPMWTFVAPDSVGTYTIFFRATFNYSASAENGALYGGFPTSSGIHGYQDKSSVSGVLKVVK